ncbi:flagellin [Limosilactobacillus reuteri]|uniref:DUF5048 domain-containing protein n=1 Tax=Limosilactobacillus reuteri TaxID=1598 RepID=UPI000D6FD71C|nr:flagellin [Limosilactobacillus reuteri]PWT34584.1 flagellin [Limosilactobacillus reuteri]PWT57654.1 flagellin [Limosilactobacillus reuteri]PWT58452.1 flagellin [Limosilactobacillus reuteri]PWT65340.1 flagellin [Limosilactobacillus reuteri]
MSVLSRPQNYNQTLPNIVTGMEEQLPGRVTNALLQPIRNLETTIQVIDDRGNIIDTITGKTVEGSISMDASSLIRRTGSLKLAVDPAYMPNKKSMLWFDKRFRIYQGIVDTSQYPREAINYLLGTFYVDETGLQFSEDNRYITVKLSDKMTNWEDSGLETKLEVKHGTPLNEAMRGILELVGETDFGYMEKTTDKEVIPYDYKKEAGTNIIDIITDFRDMYQEFVCGYDVMGRFEFRRIPMQLKREMKPSRWEFDSVSTDRADVTLSFAESYSLKDVKNRVVVVGNTSTTTGYTPKGIVTVKATDNPFNTTAIGIRTKVIQNNDLTNDMQCVSQAEYEIWKSTHFQEQANISIVPLYHLKPFDLITIKNPVSNVSAQYMIDTIDVDLDVEGTMYITAHKMYFVTPIYGEANTPLVDAIKNGIDKLGWLSLGEQRIKDAYGISADGRNTLFIRFISGALGGSQASTNAYTTTRNQIMELDLSDYQKLDFKSEDGNVGRSKADYADRVLGHEMFHAVCNDFYGVMKVIDIPIWFKEGFAELLHGGKDRYETINGFKNSEEKKNYFINMAKEQLEGKWSSTSEDYVTAYLIAAAIYYLCGSKEKMMLAFQNIENAQNINLNFLKKFLPDLGSTNEEVEQKIIKELQTMPLWEFLNDPNDPDTGSIGGNHMENLYNRPLDAENVFNNQEAKCSSIGFKIIYSD